jgi:hypothetical protein
VSEGIFKISDKWWERRNLLYPVDGSSIIPTRRLTTAEPASVCTHKRVLAVDTFYESMKNKKERGRWKVILRHQAISSRRMLVAFYHYFFYFFFLL